MAHAYRGAIGRTQPVTVHVTEPGGELVAVQVYTSVDVASHPDLGDLLQHDRLNVVRLEGGASLRVAVPVVYHDPVAEVMVLVLGDAHRHRELDERIAVLERLRDDPAAVPAYAKGFGVVFGGAGLRAYLAERAGLREHLREIDREIDGEIDPQPAAARAGDTDRFQIPIDLEDEPSEPTEPGEPGDDPLTTELTELPLDGAADAIPGGSGGSGGPGGPGGPGGTGGPGAPAETGCHLDRDGVRLVVSAGDASARDLTGALDVRVLLHRMPSYPVVVLVVGPPAAMRAPAMPQLVVLPLDIAAERDRGVLSELARTFAITIEVMSEVVSDVMSGVTSEGNGSIRRRAHRDALARGAPGGMLRGRLIRRCKLIAPLAENVAYILHAADDHLRGIAADGKPDYRAARAIVQGPGFDLLGIEHPERTEFRTGKLVPIATARELRRALAVARRFTRPAREDYLACTRGFPLRRWHELRRDVLARAIAWGLWMGSDLAQLAVSEGLVRSRRDLIVALDRGFERLRHDLVAFDLDADAAADNAAAIAGEARALGLALRPIQPDGTGAIASASAPVVSGSIHTTSAHDTPWSPEALATEQLLAQLAQPGNTRDGRTQRLAAALALCSRADPRAAGPVVAAAMTMSRHEAVRVLAMAVKFGAAAKPALLEGLTSSKAFLRHGAALALALLRTEDTTRAVIDLLLSEPTELWREVARAVGQIGSEALAPLVSQYEQRGDRATAVQERVAWAMAHIGVRGGKAAIEAMAGGQGALAQVAARALGLLALAAADQVREPPGSAGPGAERDLTVNHAFSRQFFEALDQGFPEPGTMELDVSEAEFVELDASEAVEP